MWSLFYSFNVDTWVLFVSLLCAVLLACMLISWSEYKRLGKGKANNPTELAWKMLRLQMAQPVYIKFPSLAGKILMLTYSFLQCRIIPALFQTWILFSLANITNYHKPFQSVQEMTVELARGNYKWVVRHDRHFKDGNFTGHW